MLIERGCMQDVGMEDLKRQSPFDQVEDETVRVHVPEFPPYLKDGEGIFHKKLPAMSPSIVHREEVAFSNDSHVEITGDGSSG